MYIHAFAKLENGMDKMFLIPPIGPVYTKI